MNRGLKTVILLIATVVTIFCVVYGAMVHIGGFAARSIMGALTGDVKLELGEDLKDAKTDELSDDVKVIKLKVNAGEVDVRKGNSNVISISSSLEKTAPEYTFDNGVLTVTQPDIGTVGMPGKELKNKVIITLKDEPEEISGVLELGDMDIDGITAGTIDLVLKLGDMDLNDVTANDITVENKLGDVKLNDCDFSSAVIDSKLGDVKLALKDKNSAFTFKLGVDVGEIKVDGDKFGKEHSTDSGEKTLKVHCSMGDIKITTSSVL
ncbi:MAG: DUF4097 domain-containing protein [Lachnospiraceae bacterium]|nr:DUF4097 domain-containing protein [Lachnospiraceae bacterium]